MNEIKQYVSLTQALTMSSSMKDGAELFMSTKSHLIQKRKQKNSIDTIEKGK